jgi:hypothetical protein
LIRILHQLSLLPNDTHFLRGSGGDLVVTGHLGVFAFIGSVLDAFQYLRRGEWSILEVLRNFVTGGGLNEFG